MTEEKKLKIALLWHMHQPFYFNPDTKKFQMPWVRLHGLKDYLDMPLNSASFDNIRVTYNLVPSLLDQIELYCQGYTDRHQELTAIPARDLSGEEKKEILSGFFSAHYPRMIKPYARYRNLYHKKENCRSDLSLATDTYSSSEWRDLQVWSNLVWIDPIFRGDEPFVGMFEKGQDFTEDEKDDLLKAQIDLLRRIIPEYRKLYLNGQIEISYSPYYHPILPLLIDTDSSKEAIPDLDQPSKRFSFPSDAEWQLAESMSHFQGLFGRKPAGIWPSEGSISEETLKLFSRYGVKWTASDQEILYYSMVKSGRNPRDFSTYSAYIYEKAPETRLFFRDHGLSDKIGFIYSGWEHSRAVNDFISNIKSIGESFSGRPDDLIIPIILDGENAWEYFRNDGTEFLKNLYQALSEEKNIEMITFSEAAEMLKPISIPGVYAGSWINHDFRVWIGHQEDNLAWDLLYKARQMLVEYQNNNPNTDKDLLNKAWRQIYIAEGSDWNWWYGNDHIGNYNHAFDALFRRHLSLVYEIIGQNAPNELRQPIHAGISEAIIFYPEALVTPVLDGCLTQYYEWLGSGYFDCARANEIMHRAKSMIKVIYFAYDHSRFYIRLDFENSFAFVDLDRFQIILEIKDLNLKRIFSGMKKSGTTDEYEYKFEQIFEVGIKRESLLPAGSGEIEFSVALTDGDKFYEKWPTDGWIKINIPDREKELFWQV